MIGFSDFFSAMKARGERSIDLGRGRIASLAAVEKASNAVYVPAQSATTYHSYAVTLYMLPVRMLWILLRKILRPELRDSL